MALALDLARRVSPPLNKAKSPSFCWSGDRRRLDVTFVSLAPVAFTNTAAAVIGHVAAACGHAIGELGKLILRAKLALEIAIESTGIVIGRTPKIAVTDLLTQGIP